MTNLLPYFIVFAYLTLVVELVFFSVKSQGSTYRLLKTRKGNLLENIWAVLSNILIFGIIFYPLSNLYLNWHLLSSSYWMICTGVIFVVIGRWFSFGAMIQLRRNTKILHKDKFFKMTRNPNIDGTITFLIGMWLLMPSTINIFSSILVFIYLKNRAKLEEKYLIETFGKKYVDYKNKTPISIYI